MTIKLLRHVGIAVGVLALLAPAVPLVAGTSASASTPTTSTAAATASEASTVDATVPNLGISGTSAAIWLAKEIGGGLLGAAAGKGFSEVMALLEGDKTSEKLDALKAQLDEIKGQLTHLQDTMNLALQEIEKTQYAVLALRVKTLKDSILAAQGDFVEALSYAGQPDKKATIKTLLDHVKEDVNGNGGLVQGVGILREAIGPPDALTPKTMYQALSNVLTESNTKKFFTWRDSASLDGVYQYLLYLQAIQFNLIIQVRTAEGSSTDQMYERFVQPYLGDRTTFQAFVDGKTLTPSVGSLHDELGFELSQLPAGVVLDIQSNTEWSVDVPGGAQTLSMKAEGPGVPTCYKGFPPVCVTDPHYSIGGAWPTTTPPVSAGSPQAQLADHLRAAMAVATGGEGWQPSPSTPPVSRTARGWR